MNNVLMRNKFALPSLVAILLVCFTTSSQTSGEPKTLSTEKVSGDEIWVHEEFATNKQPRVRATVWFDKQLLGDGKAYKRRAKEFADWRRSELRAAAMKTLKSLSEESFAATKEQIEELIKDEKLSNLERHWIINGFSCTIKSSALDDLKNLKGVSKIFAPRNAVPRRTGGETPEFPPIARQEFDPGRYKHPWYVRYLMADKVWKDFGVDGSGTLSIVHDFNFVYSDNVSYNVYRNKNETPGNDKDDDGNGFVDDYHGFNFDRGNAVLTTVPIAMSTANPRGMHGYSCAAIICGAGVKGKPYEFGIAPEGRWAGVIASGHLESAIEWAIEQGADTYSMSFSIPSLGDYRSHWRKVMEHGSFCGVYFVSGAGNFAQSAKVPVQMRVPEDIPDVVFAAAGVQRNFSRTPFSSKGPVEWETEHYQDGKVQKPEVCAFNMGLPLLLRDGSVRTSALNGNSFAGPMFCGSIALMVSADPDLLPWDLKEIITSTATDVAAEGVDDETGHGLINCYRAVKEVLRRKAIRDGKDPKQYEGRVDGDELDIAALMKKLTRTNFVVGAVQPNSQAAKLGLKAGDVFKTYNGDAVANPQDMQAAKRKAQQAGLKKVTVAVERGGKKMDFEFTLGPLGVFPSIEYDDPTFQ